MYHHHPGAVRLIECRLHLNGFGGGYVFDPFLQEDLLFNIHSYGGWFCDVLVERHDKRVTVEVSSNRTTIRHQMWSKKSNRNKKNAKKKKLGDIVGNGRALCYDIEIKKFEFEFISGDDMDTFVNMQRRLNLGQLTIV